MQFYDLIHMVNNTVNGYAYMYSMMYPSIYRQEHT